MVVVGGPSNFIVNQSLNLWNLEFKYFDLDFGLVESWGWVVVGGGPSNFIVNQSPNLWILEFKYFDLDFGLDNKGQRSIFNLMLMELNGHVALQVYKSKLFLAQKCKKSFCV